VHRDRGRVGDFSRLIWLLLKGMSDEKLREDKNQDDASGSRSPKKAVR